MNIVKDNKNKKKGLAVLTLAFASVLMILVTPLGVLFNILNSVYNKTIKGFINYWKNVLYQTWMVFYNLIFFVSLSIDFFGNAFCGELIELFVTTDRDTLFGKGEVTISAAIGEAEFKETLTPFGKWISKFLNFAFREETHALTAYAKWFNENND